MANKKFGAFSSSADSQKLAMTIKGLLVGTLPIAVIIINQLFQVDVGTELGQLIETIGNIIMAVGGLASVCMTGFGIVRKIYLAIKKVD